MFTRSKKISNAEKTRVKKFLTRVVKDAGGKSRNLNIGKNHLKQDNINTLSEEQYKKIHNLLESENFNQNKYIKNRRPFHKKALGLAVGGVKRAAFGVGGIVGGAVGGAVGAPDLFVGNWHKSWVIGEVGKRVGKSSGINPKNIQTLIADLYQVPLNASNQNKSKHGKKIGKTLVEIYKQWSELPSTGNSKFAPVRNGILEKVFGTRVFLAAKTAAKTGKTGMTAAKYLSRGVLQMAKKAGKTTIRIGKYVTKPPKSFGLSSSRKSRASSRGSGR